MEYSQRAEDEKTEGEHYFLSSGWDNLGCGKWRRSHWFSSLAEPSEHTKYAEDPRQLYSLPSGLRRLHA